VSYATPGVMAPAPSSLMRPNPVQPWLLFACRFAQNDEFASLGEDVGHHYPVAVANIPLTTPARLVFNFATDMV